MPTQVGVEVQPRGLVFRAPPINVPDVVYAPSSHAIVVGGFRAFGMLYTTAAKFCGSADGRAAVGWERAPRARVRARARARAGGGARGAVARR